MGPDGSGPTSPRAFFTSKRGKRFYAAAYGYKAWPIGKSGNANRSK
jgi:hypothetical protein